MSIGTDTDVELPASLLERSDTKGVTRLVCHLAVLTLTGVLVALSVGTVWLIPAMIVHGVVIGTLFAIVHEGIHFTAFRSRKLCEVAAWIAGCVIGLNSSFYRQFHYEHHRATQDPQRDPELVTPAPRTLREYLLRMSAVPYWRTRLVQTWRVIAGDFGSFPYIPRNKYGSLRRSMIANVALYVAVLLGSIYFASAWALWLWLVPLLIGQPVLRFWLVCEHTGCSNDADGYTNTRTTRTIWPVRFLMWNMPFHAEHHLRPQVPFHALPTVHGRIGHRFSHVASSYIAVNRQLISSFFSKGDVGSPIKAGGARSTET